MAVTLGGKCPWCFSGDVVNSRFRFLEIILPLFLLRPVRCRCCLRRHYRPIFYHPARRRPAPIAEVPKEKEKMPA